MRRIILVVTIYICSTLLLYSQNEKQNQAVTQLINDIFEQYAAESEEDPDYESFYNDLIQLADQPININKAEREDLEQLPFLSDQQIENILAYIYKNGSLNSIYELQLIEGLDMTDIRRMLAFVTIGESDSKMQKIYLNEIFRYGKSDILMRIDKTAERKSGYEQLLNENSELVTPYAGNSFYNSFKYNFRFKNSVSLGAVFEKDAGEQLWGAKNKSYDFNSFHLQINNIWKFKTIVLGDFRASFGQGLVFNMGYGASKSSYVLNVNNRPTGLKRFSSTDEYNFLRGVGATLQLKKAEFSLFYSFRNIDADTIADAFKTIYKTGLHRTNNEISKKHTVQLQTAGANFQYKFKMARIGFTFAYSSLSSMLLPQAEPYNIHYFRGDHQTTFGVDYKLRLGSINLFGETACTNNYGVATTNGLSFSPLSTVSLVTLWRYYSPGFDTFYANSFAENSRVNNENGIYLGAEIRPFKKWKFSVYADSYRFPWLKYGVNSPTNGMDYLFQANYDPNRSTQMFWRMKYERKQKNEAEGVIINQYNYGKAALRYQLTFNRNGFSTKNLIELSYSDSVGNAKHYGFTALQDISYQFSGFPLTVDVRCMYFDAPNYNNRFYLYEHDVLYAYSIPLLYGTGVRYYLNLKFDAFKNLSVWFKVAQTVYENSRKTIGSAFEEIKGNKKTDFRLMLRYTF